MILTLKYGKIYFIDLEDFIQGDIDEKYYYNK